MINTEDIENIEIEDIDTKDYPKFCDAYIAEASWKETGLALNDAELEELNEDYEFVHQKVFESIF